MISSMLAPNRICYVLSTICLIQEAVIWVVNVGVSLIDQIQLFTVQSISFFYKIFISTGTIPTVGAPWLFSASREYSFG